MQTQQFLLCPNQDNTILTALNTQPQCPLLDISSRAKTEPKWQNITGETKGEWPIFRQSSSSITHTLASLSVIVTTSIPQSYFVLVNTSKVIKNWFLILPEQWFTVWAGITTPGSILIREPTYPALAITEQLKFGMERESLWTADLHSEDPPNYTFSHEYKCSGNLTCFSHSRTSWL